MSDTPKNLTNSQIDRQNILNNPFALDELTNHINLKGILFDGQLWYTTNQVAKYFDVDLRTVQRYLERNEVEIKQNGYKIFTGKDLEIAKSMLLYDMDVAKNTPSLGMFNFRAFLNLGMLLNDSQKAKELRSVVLDVVIGVMNNKLGISRKYVNQNDILFKPSHARHTLWFHPKLTQSLKDYVDMGQTKYPYYTDKIYQFLFKERSREYKTLLDLKSRESPIDTHYTEVITAISQFDVDFAQEIREKSQEIGRKLQKSEVDSIFDSLIARERWQPLLINVLDIIASRDYGLRDIIHPKLEKHIRPMSAEEYKRFLSHELSKPELSVVEQEKLKEIQSQDLFAQFEEDAEIYKRMKDK